jgi:hypothetical protein
MHAYFTLLENFSNNKKSPTKVEFCSRVCMVLTLQRKVVVIHFVCLSPFKISLHRNRKWVYTKSKQIFHHRNWIDSFSSPLIIKVGGILLIQSPRLSPAPHEKSQPSCSSPPLSLRLLVSVQYDAATTMAAAGFCLLQRHSISRYTWVTNGGGACGQCAASVPERLAWVTGGEGDGHAPPPLRPAWCTF